MSSPPPDHVDPAEPVDPTEPVKPDPAADPRVDTLLRGILAPSRPALAPRGPRTLWALVLHALAGLLRFGRPEAGDGWTLQPWRAHRRARRLLDEPWAWSLLDDNAPFGRQAAAEVLEAWRLRLAEERSPDPIVFLEARAKAWQGRAVSAHWWQQLVPEELAPRGRLLPLDHGQWRFVCWLDELTIGLALSQLVLQGAVKPALIDRARVSLRRQAGLPGIEVWNPEWQVRCRWLEGRLNLL